MRIKVVPPEEDLRPPSRRASTSYHGGQRADLDDDGLPPLDAQRRLLADQALDFELPPLKLQRIDSTDSRGTCLRVELTTTRH